MSVFRGKVYLLIDQRISGVAEAFAMSLKNENIATVVGQKIDGAQMFVNRFR